MKKNGFTLAEVLITMGIIGVVAALTAPALIQDVSNAKIGPTLSKVKSTLENANRAIMQEANTVDLQAAVNLAAGNNNYRDALADRLAGARTINDNNINNNPHAVTDFGQELGNAGQPYFNGNIKLQMQNNITLTFIPPNANIPNYSSGNNSTGFRGPFAELAVDIDGWASGVNQIGFDIFYFIIDRNGGLIPEGSIAMATTNNGGNAQFILNNHWSSQDNNIFSCNNNSVGNGRGCAGSVFENNMKVIYK